MHSWTSLSTAPTGNPPAAPTEARGTRLDAVQDRATRRLRAAVSRRAALDRPAISTVDRLVTRSRPRGTRKVRRGLTRVGRESGAVAEPQAGIPLPKSC